jgi:putative oxidoreductase
MTSVTTAPPNRTLLDTSLLVMRIIVGIIFAVHGSQKMWGWFGGNGLQATVEMLGVGPVGYLVAIGEFFGGVGLILGFLSRFSAASLVVIMLGAIQMVHGKNGFLMSSGGFEYNLALIGLLIPILLLGPGQFAVGRFLPLPKSSKTGRTVIGLE